MNDFNPNNPPDFDSDDRGEIAWNEFDWEIYLREQDDIILRYLAFYEHLKSHPARIDEVARLMGWSTMHQFDADETAPASDPNANAPTNLDGPPAGDDDWDTGPYTLLKNYIYIATKALYLSLTRAWERIAEKPERVPQPLALAVQTALHTGETNSMLAIQALDFGDFAMAVSLFKRALADLNRTLSLFDDQAVAHSRALADYRTDAFQRLFDLRELWLRMIRDCRIEIAHPSDLLDDDEDDDEDDD